MNISIVGLAQAGDVELWRSRGHNSGQWGNIFVSKPVLLLSQDLAPSRDILGHCVGCEISGGLLSFQIPLCI